MLCLSNSATTSNSAHVCLLLLWEGLLQKQIIEQEILCNADSFTHNKWLQWACCIGAAQNQAYNRGETIGD